MKLYYIPQNLTTFSIILIVAKRFVSCKLLLKSAVNILRNILQISDVCESKKEIQSTIFWCSLYSSSLLFQPYLFR